MIATARQRQRKRAGQNPAYRLVRHFLNVSDGFLASVSLSNVTV
jgi:hypothetical protein